MKFECPRCKKSGQIDDSRVPDVGIYATCPQCNAKFLIKKEAPKEFVFEPVSYEPVRPEPQPANINRSQISNDDDLDVYCSACGFKGTTSRTKLPTSGGKGTCPSCKRKIFVTCSGNSTNTIPKIAVGGWLYLLIFNLVISGPLIAIGNLIVTWNNIENYINKSAGLSGGFVSYISGFAFPIALCAWGIYCGISLWKVEAEAVHKAKAFLILGVVVSVFSSVGFYNLVTFEAKPYLIEDGIKHVISTMIYASIWYAYLSISKRVAYTYPDSSNATISNIVDVITK